ncbi:type IV secretory system conjugative DNA transfer family protein, partial [Chamaesiphon polymorphus]
MSQSSQIAHHQTSSQPSPQISVQNWLSSPLGLILLACSVYGVAMLLDSKPQHQKLGTAYWGGRKEKKAARKRGEKQLNNPGSKIANTCLYINKPKWVRIKQREELIAKISKSLKQHGLSEEQIELKIAEQQANLPPLPQWYELFDRTVYFPDAQRSIIGYGAADTGKSYGFMNPLLRSVLDRDFTLTMFDFKYPEQTKEIAGYARELGYKIQIFAPGFIESCVCNLLDYISDSGDGVKAGQLAQTMIKNLAMGERDSGNEFFTDAGINLVKAVFLAAKWVAEQLNRPEFGDLLTAATIISLPNLSARMNFATKRLNIWNAKAFSQFIGVGGGNLETNVTEGGIIANASKIFQRFVEREFVPSICGTSDLQPDLDGKTLTIIGLNQDYRDIVSPILATVIDALVSRNVNHAREREAPFVFSGDEVPTIYLPRLKNWLAEARSAGFIALLFLQNYAQLVESYGENGARTIAGNCGTKIFLNPQDSSSAKEYSEYLGKKDIVYWTKSTTSAGSKDGKATTTRTQHVQEVPLMAPDEFLKLPQGRGVVISPGQENKDKQEVSIPILQNMSIAPADIAD